MTTIAYKNKILAFDSLVTESGRRVGKCVKGRKGDNVIVAGCGSAQDAEMLMEWIMAGADQKLKNEYGIDRELETQVIAVYKNGDCVTFESYAWPIFCEAEFIAIGSGAEFALGAMAAGKSAKEAVEIAAKFDLTTGGEVIELSWQENTK